MGGTDQASHPFDTGVWAVGSLGGPTFSITNGIGYIVNPTMMGAGQNAADFSMHDHVYSSDYVPNAFRSVVTYQFDAPTLIDRLYVTQHYWGVNVLGGYAGNSLDSLTYLGAVQGSAGAGPFAEGALSIYDFPLNVAGIYFQFVVESTPHPSAYALYRAIPAVSESDQCDPDCESVPVPEPASFLLLSTGLAGVLRTARSVHEPGGAPPMRPIVPGYNTAVLLSPIRASFVLRGG